MDKSDLVAFGLDSKGKRSPKLDLLSKVDMFRDLSQEEIQKIEEMVKTITCKKGYIFYRPDEEAEVLFLLKKGKVYVYSETSKGKRLILETINAGTFFGEMPLTGQSMRRAYAEAIEESLICILSRQDLEKLLLEKPQVALRLVDNLSQRLQETQTKLEEAMFQNATARVGRTILRLARGSSELDGPTHQDLADATGLHRETVTGILDRLQTLGILELSTKKINILDPSGLKKVAEK